MRNKYYIAKRYYTNGENYVEQYWDGDGFSVCEVASKKYPTMNMAADIAHMLHNIATMQDEKSVKYVIYTLRYDAITTCQEVEND